MTRLSGDLESRIRHYLRPRQPEPYGLEIHASHACNLHCESCSHFSNHSIGGNVPLREAEAWTPYLAYAPAAQTSPL